jgi:hypothetical protein
MKISFDFPLHNSASLFHKGGKDLQEGPGSFCATTFQAVSKPYSVKTGYGWQGDQQPSGRSGAMRLFFPAGFASDQGPLVPAQRDIW